MGSLWIGEFCQEFNFKPVVEKLIELQGADLILGQGLVDAGLKIDTVDANLNLKIDEFKNETRDNIEASLVESHDFTVAEIAAFAVVVEGDIDDSVNKTDVKFTGITDSLSSKIANVGLTAYHVQLNLNDATIELNDKIDEHHNHTVVAIADAVLVSKNYTDSEVLTAKTDLDSSITTGLNETNNKFDSITNTLVLSIASNVQDISDLTDEVSELSVTVANNTAEIETEISEREEDVELIQDEIDTVSSDVTLNAAAIQANTDDDDTFRSFNWTKGVEIISNMINSDSQVDMIGYEETLEDLIDAPFSSSDDKK